MISCNDKSGGEVDCLGGDTKRDTRHLRTYHDHRHCHRHRGGRRHCHRRDNDEDDENDKHRRIPDVDAKEPLCSGDKHHHHHDELTLCYVDPPKLVRIQYHNNTEVINEIMSIVVTGQYKP